MIPRSTAVTMGNASGIVDCEYADERLVESGVQEGLERIIDESAVIPAIFDS
jgi:hypothetical protein